jgi:hypothetical protein
MQRVMPVILMILWTGMAAGQNGPLQHKAARMATEGRVSMIQLAPRFTTTVRVPEPVSSIIVGDANLFQAEHSASEPLLVFIRPATPGIAETNLLITTISGRQFPLLLKSNGEAAASAVDLLVACQMFGTSLIEESYSSSLLAENLRLDSSTNEEKPKTRSVDQDPYVRLIERQRRRPLPNLHGERLRVGIGQVIASDDSQFVVVFSVLNSTHDAIELLIPQIQLAGQVKSGLFKRDSHWTSVEQIPVMDFRLNMRKLDPGMRTDGLVVFKRPALKQSDQKLLLQVADAAMVDRPVLVPINFSVTNNPEDGYDQ